MHVNTCRFPDSYVEIDRRDADWFAALGKSCIHMTWKGRGAISLEVCGLVEFFSTLFLWFLFFIYTSSLPYPRPLSPPSLLSLPKQTKTLDMIKQTRKHPLCDHKIFCNSFCSQFLHL